MCSASHNTIDCAVCIDSAVSQLKFDCDTCKVEVYTKPGFHVCYAHMHFVDLYVKMPTTSCTIGFTGLKQAAQCLGLQPSNNQRLVFIMISSLECGMENRLSCSGLQIFYLFD